MANNPIDTVIELQKQGLNNNQIVQALQKDGLTSAQIFEAMNLADQKTYSQTQSQAPPPVQGNPMGLNPQSMVSSAPPPIHHAQPSQSDDEQIEQLIEAVIDEKWQKIESKIMAVADWKNDAQDQMKKLEQQITDLKNDYDSLQKAIVGKVGEYDKNILNVGSQLEAMETAFSKILPTFTENINELDRITKNMKK